MRARLTQPALSRATSRSANSAMRVPLPFAGPSSSFSSNCCRWNRAHARERTNQQPAIAATVSVSSPKPIARLTTHLRSHSGDAAKHAIAVITDRCA